MTLRPSREWIQYGPHILILKRILSFRYMREERIDNNQLDAKVLYDFIEIVKLIRDYEWFV